ncbi:hypothetical protein [Microbacterium sp. AG238]|uniref:hypothetical protein n=1 Tax=Microbacterium sp. AG238 TaxID=2183994 RepID=UPI0011C44D06|nr:hypothetical protein [Microbacterium sp. AG238]
MERDLLAGGTFRGVARRFGLSSDSLRRHVRGHVADALRDDILDASGTRGVELASRVLDVMESARDVRLDAESDGRTAIAAGRAELEALSFLQDRLGVTKVETGENVRDALDLLAAVRAIAREHPSVVLVLADGLEARGRTAWARQYREAIASLSESTTREVTA